MAKVNTAEKLKNHPKIGSYAKLGEIAGVNRCAAWNWSKKPGGRVPRIRLQKIIKWAKRRRIQLGLRMEDFV